MPLRETKGAASAQGFGAGINGNTNVQAPYVDDVFNTYVYTGNGSSQTIQNGIDLATKGGLVWTKDRSVARTHILKDSFTGISNYLVTATTAALTSDVSGLGGPSNFAFTTNGYTQNNAFFVLNNSGDNYVSWTFRKAPKFFDVVTYTGDDNVSRAIPHSLNSVPGFVIIKATSTSGSWFVGARNSSGTYYRTVSTGAGALNDTGALEGPYDLVGLGYLTSTTFNPSTIAGGTTANGNASGVSYVAYLFGNDTTSNGIIQCGSFSATAGTDVVTSLGWEPQYVLVKQNSAGQNWIVYDTMRGMPVSGSSLWLNPNTSGAETNPGAVTLIPTATGFTIPGGQVNTATYIYMAIRRPNKPPTSGTQVYAPTISNAVEGTQVNTGFPIDFQMAKLRSGVAGHNDQDRLRGISTVTSTSASQVLASNSTVAESTQTGPSRYWNSTGFQVPTYYDSQSYSYQNFKRAPGFFDVICYTGTGTSSRTVAHNLQTTPQLLIYKSRSAVSEWGVLVETAGTVKELMLNATDAGIITGVGMSYFATPTTVTVGLLATGSGYNLNGITYVGYLFSTLVGISKVGNYVGNGSSQTINCGFSSGARFVLIKRLDSVGDWYEWDTARGMVSGTDPYLLLNTQDAEVNANSVYTVTTGFQIVSTAAGINASGGSYIFFAVA